MDMKKEELISELTDFVMTSSDADNMIVSIFIAGMQAKGNMLLSVPAQESDRQSHD
mgnify:CR=1 FL=1